MVTINSLQKKLTSVIGNLTGKRVKGQGEFSRRIKHRHTSFWNTADAELVRNTTMQASDSIEKWKDVTNWQRKLSNKFNSREFAKLHNCRVAELYWKGKDVNTLDFTKLPNQYVIRPTIGHSCGLVFLMNDGINLMDKRAYSEQQIKEELAQALSKNSNLEFLVEEFVRTEEGEYTIPDDFKLYIFNGKLASIQVIKRIGPGKGFSCFYDENWNLMQRVNTNFPQGVYQNPPKCLAEMITQAKKLSESYEIFARIDFYATDKGAVFGEFTPTPAMGDYFTPYGDKLFIDYWNKYCTGMI